MTDKPMSDNERRLIRRYLVWCYKTTKEDLDRVDRYFTQNAVDDFILSRLLDSEEFRSAAGHQEYKKRVQSFEEYKIDKYRKAEEQKFTAENKLRPEYLYLSKRMEAIVAAMEQFLGKKDSANVVELYEEEMTRRILSAREHT